MIPTVIMVGADKGGVGKTTIARTLLDYLATRRVEARAFDTEAPGGDLVRFAPGAPIVDISTMQDQMLVFDGVSEKVLTVVDIRAGLLSPTIRALDEAQLLEAVRAGAMQLVLLHVLGPTISSIDEIAKAAAALRGARHLLVKNHTNETRFFDWDKGPARALFEQMTDRTINVPQLPAVACEVMQKRGGSFLSYVEDKNESRMLTGRVRTWLGAVWAEFDRVNILGREAAELRGATQQ